MNFSHGQSDPAIRTSSTERQDPNSKKNIPSEEDGPLNSNSVRNVPIPPPLQIQSSLRSEESTPVQSLRQSEGSGIAPITTHSPHQHQRSTRLPRIDPSIVEKSASDPNQFQVNWSTKNLLYSVGFGHYAELFAQHSIPAHMLSKITSAELRDDLGIKSLGHRRELLRAVCPSTKLPKFGRILVALSAERTMYSWLSSAVQCAILAGAIVRLSPVFRSSTQANLVASIITVVGMIGATWGGARFFKEIRWLESNRRFQPDYIGAVIAFVGSIVIATGCLYLVLVEGFIWE